MMSLSDAKSRLKRWIARRPQKLSYARWLSSTIGPQPDPALRSFAPSLTSRLGLLAYHALRGQFAIPERLYVPSTPLAKVRAIRWHARHYGLRFFVETGTAFGATTAAVCDLFETCWTIELSPQLHRRAEQKFSGTNVACLHGDSGVLLPRIVAHLTGAALFWLDAHATGGDLTADAGYDPIFAELDAILSSPDKHVILIDDARGHDVEGIRRKVGEDRCVLRNDILRVTPRSPAV